MDLVVIQRVVVIGNLNGHTISVGESLRTIQPQGDGFGTGYEHTLLQRLNILFSNGFRQCGAKPFLIQLRISASYGIKARKRHLYQLFQVDGMRSRRQRYHQNDGRQQQSRCQQRQFSHAPDDHKNTSSYV